MAEQSKKRHHYAIRNHTYCQKKSYYEAASVKRANTNEEIGPTPLGADRVGVAHKPIERLDDPRNRDPA
jgi:hypothetical protein